MASHDEFKRYVEEYAAMSVEQKNRIHDLLVELSREVKATTSLMKETNALLTRTTTPREIVDSTATSSTNLFSATSSMATSPSVVDTTSSSDDPLVADYFVKGEAVVAMRGIDYIRREIHEPGLPKDMYNYTTNRSTTSMTTPLGTATSDFEFVGRTSDLDHDSIVAKFISTQPGFGVVTARDGHPMSGILSMTQEVDALVNCSTECPSQAIEAGVTAAELDFSKDIIDPLVVKPLSIYGNGAEQVVVSNSSIDSNAPSNYSTKCSSEILDAVASVAAYTTHPLSTNIRKTHTVIPGPQIDHITSSAGLFCTETTPDVHVHLGSDMTHSKFVLDATLDAATSFPPELQVLLWPPGPGPGGVRSNASPQAKEQHVTQEVSISLHNNSGESRFSMLSGCHWQKQCRYVDVPSLTTYGTSSDRLMQCLNLFVNSSATSSMYMFVEIFMSELGIAVCSRGKVGLSGIMTSLMCDNPALVYYVKGACLEFLDSETNLPAILDPWPPPSKSDFILQRGYAYNSGFNWPFMPKDLIDIPYILLFIWIRVCWEIHVRRIDCSHKGFGNLVPSAQVSLRNLLLSGPVDSVFIFAKSSATLHDMEKLLVLFLVTVSDTSLWWDDVNTKHLIIVELSWLLFSLLVTTKENEDKWWVVFSISIDHILQRYYWSPSFVEIQAGGDVTWNKTRYNLLLKKISMWYYIMCVQNGLLLEFFRSDPLTGMIMNDFIIGIVLVFEDILCSGLMHRSCSSQRVPNSTLTQNQRLKQSLSQV